MMSVREAAGSAPEEARIDADVFEEFGDLVFFAAAACPIGVKACHAIIKAARTAAHVVDVGDAKVESAAAAAATAAVDDEVKGVGGGAGAVEKGIRGRRAGRERAQNVGFGSESGTVSRSVARGGKRALEIRVIGMASLTRAARASLRLPSGGARSQALKQKPCAGSRTLPSSAGRRQVSVQAAASSGSDGAPRPAALVARSYTNNGNAESMRKRRADSLVVRAAAAEAENEEVPSKVRNWRLYVFACIWVLYSIYYITRGSFTYSAPALRADLDLSMTDIGRITSIFPLMYGMSKFASGKISSQDKGTFLLSSAALLSSYSRCLTAPRLDTTLLVF